jgi:general secretion pathway protein D
VSEGEQAEILIGDRVPIPTTSFNTSQTIGGNIVPITSFTYQNVGITVQIEPRVHHNREVTLRVQVEISQISDFVDTGGGQSQPIIGTRQIQTVIRLRDGETNMLAGLISRSDTDTVAGVAGISDVPILRRVLGNNTTSRRETDIVLTLTPRIIRIPDITEEDLVTLWVGTEENMRLRGSARHETQAGPFSPMPTNGAEPTAGGRGGTISRITPSDEVMRDREEAARRIGNGATLPPPEEFEPEPAVVPEAVEPPAVEPPAEAIGEPMEDAIEAPVPMEEMDEGEVNEDEPAPEPEPPSNAAITVMPSSTEVGVGDTLSVSVELSNAHNVGSVPFRLQYNPQVLEYVAGQQGSFLASGGGPEPVFLATGQNGEVVVGLSRTGGDGADGGGTLATFDFRAIGPGDARLQLSGVSLKDPRAGNLPVNILPGPPVAVVGSP